MSGLINKEQETLTISYKELLKEIKDKVKSSQLKASLAVNKELIKLYWEIGCSVQLRQDKEGWGSRVIQYLAKDLQSSFSGIQGFSRTNLFRMRAFYLAYKKVPQAVGQLEKLPIFTIPWGHNILIIERVELTEARLWYARKTLEEDCIKSNLYNQKGKEIINFSELSAISNIFIQ